MIWLLLFVLSRVTNLGFVIIVLLHLDTSANTAWASHVLHSLRLKSVIIDWNAKAELNIVCVMLFFYQMDIFSDTSINIYRVWPKCINPYHHVYQQVYINKSQNAYIWLCSFVNSIPRQNVCIEKMNGVFSYGRIWFIFTKYLFGIHLIVKVISFVRQMFLYCTQILADWTMMKIQICIILITDCIT